MKILSISNSPLVESQGSGYVITNFCRGLKERGHEVELFGLESYEPLRFLKGKAKSYRLAIGMLFFTLAQIAKKNYDIIEFYGGESWLTAWILKRIANRNFLIVSHSNGLETYYNEVLVKYYKDGYVENPFPKWYQINQSSFFVNAFTQVDALVTVSENDLNYALKHKYLPLSSTLAINNSLPDEYLGLDVKFEREPIIGYCGSWLTNKGIEIIKKDIYQILLEFPNCLFKLIGVGQGFDKQIHFPLSVCPRIEVIPFVNKKSLKNIYNLISILILPSCYESFGLVTAESMACGCAIVATRMGFAASLKHGEEALIMEKPASPFLYEAVKELLLNESLRQKIARNGYQRVQQLRWNSAIDSLENAYTKWLEEFRNFYRTYY